MKAESTSRRRTIGTTLAIVLAASMVGLAANFAADAVTVPDGLPARLAAGRLDPAELPLIALTGAAVLVQPLIVIALLLAIEMSAGPRGRSRKDRRLAWLVQTLFVTAATLLTVGVGALGLLPDEPLLSVAGSAGPVATALQTAFFFLLAIAFADFLRYWVHRAQHAVPLLWKFHAVHHGPEDLDVLHNFTHPIEKLTNLLLITVPTAFLVGADGGTLFLLAGFFAIQGQLLHMNVPLHYGRLAAILADNRFHFIHHSRDPADFNANYAGVLPVYDRLFGSYRAPRGETLPPTGLAGWDGAPGLADYLLARRIGASRADSAPGTKATARSAAS